MAVLCTDYRLQLYEALNLVFETSKECENEEQLAFELQSGPTNRSAFLMA